MRTVSMAFSMMRCLHRSCRPLTTVDIVTALQMAPIQSPRFRDIPRRCVTEDIHRAIVHGSGDNTRKKRHQRVKERRDSGRSSYRFVDRTRFQVSGGVGGKGGLSMYHINHKHKRQVDGGNGGSGGSVVIVADPGEQSLRWTNPHVVGEEGAHGGSQKMNGRRGKNTILRVPCGVVVRRFLDFDEEWDEETKTVRKLHVPVEEEDSLGGTEAPFRFRNPNHPDLASKDYDSDEEESDDDDDDENEEESDDDDDDGDYSSDDNVSYDGYLTDSTENSFAAWGEREKVVIAQLDEPGSHVVVARGGRGGIGSSKFAKMNGPPPPPAVLARHATPEPGETVFLELELKLIADIGLVGFPNAGKSSLLAAMSRATPHIAPYPFTTLNPLVGYIEYRDGFRVCAADIPGLIEGASEGRGMGHDFLRHLERTKALLYIVDVAGVDGRDPVEDLKILIDEIAAYGDGKMLERNALVVANKVDLLDQAQYEDVTRGLQKVVEDGGIQISGEILGISAGVSGIGLPSLSRAIREIVVKSSTAAD